MREREHADHRRASRPRTPSHCSRPRQARRKRALDRMHQDGDEERERQRHRDHRRRFQRRTRSRMTAMTESNPTTTLEVGRADPLPRAGSGRGDRAPAPAAPWAVSERLNECGGRGSARPCSSRSVPRCRSPWRAGRGPPSSSPRNEASCRRAWPLGCGSVLAIRAAFSLLAPCLLNASYRSSSLI